MQQCDWYTAQELADMNLPGIPNTKRGVNKFASKHAWPFRKRKGKGGGREFNIHSIPHAALTAYMQSNFPLNQITHAQDRNSNDDIDCIAYANAPEYNRKIADKYLKWIRRFDGLCGTELKSAIRQEQKLNPNIDVPSYRRLNASRKIYEREGVEGLLGSYGNRAGKSKIRPEWQKHFNSLYLTEKLLSVRACWKMTLGKFCNDKEGASSFPSPTAFQRRLEQQFPKSAIYLHRYGFKKWNRKFGNYIPRDISDLKAGQCWVADHAQLDIFVRLKNGKVVAPWVTAWIDAKSTKGLSALLHPDPPNSDHVFQSFHHAAIKFGLPECIYLDNGKDYRCRDFAGKPQKHTVNIDEAQTTTMMSLLNVEVIFAIPYNAQAKPIERTFLKFKESFSKNFETYRGGNVIERPETLLQKIKNGESVYFEEFERCFNEYVFEIYNKTPSHGRYLQGRSPDDQWNSESPIKRMVSKEALKLFCMRTSKPVVIGRNGINDGDFGVSYWSDWMIHYKGRKVYVRRDIKDFNEAWVFSAETDEYLGNAFLVGLVPFLAKTPTEKKILKELMAEKRREVKLLRELGKSDYVPSVQERLTHLKKATMLLSPEPVPEGQQNVVLLANTKMDKVALAKKQHAKSLEIKEKFLDKLYPKSQGTDNSNVKVPDMFDRFAMEPMPNVTRDQEEEKPEYNFFELLGKVNKQKSQGGI